MIRYIKVIIALYFWVVVAIAVGCTATTGSAKKTEDGAGDSDGDSDTDGDSDADNDTDSDSDTDGPTIPPTCEAAAEVLTSVGCDFFAADLANDYSVDHLPFAIVISNPHESQNAQVTLEHGLQGQIFEEVLAPGELQVIDVACSSGCLVQQQEISPQGIGDGTGFRVTADVPILAYQWNTYGTYIESVDASLLIPVTSLDGTYLTAAWDVGASYGYGQIAIVVIEDDTSISLTPSVNLPEQGGLGPFFAGETSSIESLNSFDVIALRPALTDNDLTGTVVQADKPVVVFGGHTCAFVPYDQIPACDHLEEQILPLSAWGTSTVLARHAPRLYCIDNVEDPVTWRVVAGADDMHIELDPPPPIVGAEHEFTQQGEILTFESTTDHVIAGILNNPEDPEAPEAPFFAYQLMTSTRYADCGYEGDPMMLQSPPAGQFLDRYVFVTDDMFDFNYDHIIIVRPTSAEVELDCLGTLPDSDFEQVGSSDWEVARVFIDDPYDSTGCSDGARLLTASAPVGLSVVGTSPFVSYGYLGGVGVRSINPYPVIE